MSSPSSSRSSGSAFLVTDPNKNKYDVRELELVGHNYASDYPILDHVLGAHIAHFTVEFLYTNNIKPHVVFKLNFASEFKYTASNGEKIRIVSARVSMELGEGSSGQGPGACMIKLCNYIEKTDRAAAGFRFKLLKDRTLSDFIRVIKGEHPELLPKDIKGDLTRFTFVVITEHELFDGCRDWM